MRKTLLVASMATLFATGIYADNHTYTYVDSEGFPIFGMFRRVSPNGKWAAGGDETYDTGGFLVNTDEPEELLFTEDGYLLDVDDNGLAVGSNFYRTAGGAVYHYAGIFKDGEWQLLPLPENVLPTGTSCAVAISADSKRIAGHAMRLNEGPDMPGRYCPITWKLNEATGQYEIDTFYSSLYLPGTLGFFVYAMTPDGRYIAGLQCLDFSDTVAVMLDTETGELIHWNEIEIRDFDFEGLGTFPQMFVDGVMDGLSETDAFNGRIVYATNRYLFGSHSTVSNVNYETGEGTITTFPAIYDLQTKEWIEGDQMYGMYLCGTGPDQVFTITGKFVKDGLARSIDSVVEGPDHIDGIYGFSNDGKVWGGSQQFDTGMGEILETPALAMFQVPELSGVKVVATDVAHRARITVENGTIRVDSAREVAIYSAAGALVTRSATATVAPGAYIIVADGKSYKTIVR